MRIKNNKGITLIALVITIIVLLILAGVTINMVLGDDGIIAQAQQAKQTQEKAEEKQTIKIAVGEAGTSEHLGVLTASEVTSKSGGTITFTEENPYNNSIRDIKVFGTGAEAKYLPIPKGMAWAYGSIDEGAVVVDGYGNEFVWVPVDDFSKFAKAANTGVEGDYQGILYDVNSDGTMQEKTNYGQGKTYSEPANLSTSDDNKTNILGFNNNLFQDEYNKMAESVKIYKGFYVGRYETGGFNATKVVSKPGEDQASCTNVTWYEMYRMQKELYGENASVTSGMIYGAQRDAIMLWMKDVPNVTDSSKKYIKDSTDMGNYGELCPSCNGDECYKCDWDGSLTGTPIETGSNPAYSVKNIFDLAGNYAEWSQEAIGSLGRVFRGGSYRNSGLYSASYRRNGYSPGHADVSVSSRLQLYIK